VVNRVVPPIGRRRPAAVIEKIMAKVLVKSAWGSDDPTKAAFAFLHGNALAEAGRKLRNGTGTTAVRLARVRCPLNTGTVVVVSGPEMTIEGYISALQQALDQAKRANKEALDIRTAERVWKDRSKVAGD